MLLASPYVLLSVGYGGTLYSINFLCAIVQSLESRSRLTGAFPFFPNTIYHACQLKLIRLKYRKGEENTKQRIGRNAIYLPLSSFINLHLLSSNTQENHSFTPDRDAHYPSSNPMKNYSAKIIHI